MLELNVVLECLFVIFQEDGSLICVCVSWYVCIPFCEQSWVERAGRQALLSNILDLSELFHPDTFLNALRQETAR